MAFIRLDSTLPAGEDVEKLHVRRPGRVFEAVGQQINTTGVEARNTLNRSDVSIRSVFPKLTLRPTDCLSKKQKVVVRQQRLLDYIEPPQPDDFHSVRLVRECFDAICEVVGIDSNLFAVSVFHSDEPNAYVNLVQRRVALSSALLFHLGSDPRLLQAVIGHELGHVVLKHYDDTDPLFGEDQRGLDDEPYDEIKIVLANTARSYDQEYQADRLSCLALTFAGVPPQSMIEALKRIEFAQQKDHGKKEYEDGDEKSIVPWITQSHPMTRRRIKSLRNLIRNLPEVTPSTKKTAKKRATVKKGIDVQESEAFGPSFDWLDGMNTIEDEKNPFYRDCFEVGKTSSSIPDPFTNELSQSVHELTPEQMVYVVSQLGTQGLSVKDFKRFEKILLKKDPSIDVEERFWKNKEQGDEYLSLKKDVPVKMLRAAIEAFVECNFLLLSRSERPLNENIEQLDLFPDEVNAIFGKKDSMHVALKQWKENVALKFNNEKQVLSPQLYARAWWGQTMNRIYDVNGRGEIERDIAEYDLETLRGLIRAYDIQEYVSFEYAAEQMRDDLYNKHIGPRSAFIVGSALCKAWLQRKPENTSDVDHIRALLQELDIYWNDHGYPFPLIYTRIAYVLNSLYEQGNEAQKDEVLSLKDDFIDHFEIDTHQGGCYRMFGEFLRQGITQKDTQKKETEGESKIVFPEDILNVSNSVHVRMGAGEFDPSIERSLGFLSFTMAVSLQDCETHQHEATSSLEVHLTIPKSYDGTQMRACIREACNAFQIPDDLKRSVFVAKFSKRVLDGAKRAKQEAITTAEAARLFLLEKAIPHFRSNLRLRERIGELLQDNASQDALRDLNIRSVARALSSEEFERQYLSERGRAIYEKTLYADLDRGISYLAEFRRLWQLGFGQEYLGFVRAGDRTSAVSLLSETFPIECAHRDQAIAAVLANGNFDVLNNIEDVAAVQQLIATTEDIPLLVQLQHEFHNLFLRLSVSNRLYELHTRLGEEAFLDAIPTDVRDEQFAILSRLSGVATSPQFQKILCILLCYPSASYSRDELLTPILDGAHNWQEKQDVANLSSDPPFGVVGTRLTHNVMVHESLFAAFQKLKAIDKAETLLYLLKHRNFLSGIDNEFRGQRGAALTNNLRWDHILGQTREYDSPSLPDDRLKVSKRGKKTRYKVGQFVVPEVSQPDAIIRLQKHAGIPVDLIFKQHNVAVSHREQLEAMTEVLFGETGILQTEHRNNLLRKIGHLMVQQGSFSERPEERNAIESLVTVILLNCPDDKLPTIFLDMWHLAAEGGQRPLPEIVAKMMQKAGPVFVVAAQYLAHQTNALPLDWVQAFRTCVDENRIFDTTLIDAHISAHLGTNPFADIHEKKGEGSKAIVNRVSLPDGRDCVIKIFHGFIRRELPADIQLLQALVSHVNEHPGLFNVHLPRNLAEVVQEKMIRQTDPRSEMEGHENLRAVLSDSLLGVKFSTVDLIQEHSAHSLLTFGHIDGVPLDKAEELNAMGISKEQQRTMRNATGLEVLRQILLIGKYQSDPNLGNFLVGKDCVVYWVDYGSMESLDTKDRLLLINLLKSVMLGSTDRLAVPLSNLIAYSTRDAMIVTKIDGWLAENCGRFSVESIETLLTEFQDFCAMEGYVLNPQWISVLGTLGLLKPLIFDCPPIAYAQALGATLWSKQ